MHLVVELDGGSIIDDVFAVENQHTWVSYDLHLDPGAHEIVVSAPEHAVDMEAAASEAAASKSFTLDDERWALVSFWLGEEDATQPFGWTFSDEILLVE